MIERIAVGSLPATDVERLGRLKERMEAQSLVEVIRRLAITAETLLDHQEKGDIVLCRKDKPDKLLWLL